MSTPWSFADFDAHESVHFFEDRPTGLRAIIAIHSTCRGPAAGGVRFATYERPEDALTDALRLSRGMSYKNALAGLPLGGGKGVVLDCGDAALRPAQLRAFGDAIESLGGRYITAEDVGMNEADMALIAERSAHVSGLAVSGDVAGGDPGPVTAHGVWLGIRAAARRLTGSEDTSGLRIAIQGVGSVGGGVARRLARDGARIVLADRNRDKASALAAEIGATCVDPDAIVTCECDILSPNALGAILNMHSIPALRCRAVAGGANNQLATAADSARLHARGILYAPDYVINAGGIINVGLAHLGETDRAAVLERVDEIPGRLQAIWDESDARDVPPADVADAIAQRLIGRS